MNNGYLGYDNKARRIKCIYVGSDSKAHICYKGYVGRNGKAQLVYRYNVPVPTVTGNYTYNTQEQSAVITNLDTEVVNVTGTLKATNAGTYSITFSLKYDYTYWMDGTRANKTFTWSIAKSAINMVISKVSSTKTEHGHSFTDYDYVVRAKLANTNIMLDLPANTSAQLDGRNEEETYQWRDYTVNQVSSNRFYYRFSNPTLQWDHWFTPAGNAKASFSIPATSNTLAASSVIYTGSNSLIYTYNNYEEDYNVYTANLTLT